MKNRNKGEIEKIEKIKGKMGWGGKSESEVTKLGETKMEKTIKI